MSKNRKGIFREIDLAPYRNKTITLVFRTLSPDPRRLDQGPDSARESLPFLPDHTAIVPVIARPAPKRAGSPNSPNSNHRVKARRTAARQPA